MSEPVHTDEARTKVREASGPEPSPLVSAYLIDVVQGPRAGTRLEVTVDRPNPLLVGQSPACDLPITDPLVSRRHLALESTPTGLRVTDLRSTNGTTVNGVRVQEAFIDETALIRIGDTVLRASRGAPIAAPTSSRHMRFGKVVGASLAMRRLYPLCARLANSDVPVIVEGETGTGKEQLAEALHEMGPRARGPFTVLDCTAIAPSLAESALFGHERGAFTGAMTTKKGCFEVAHEGTLLIDEIGDLDASLQAKLLRAIERREIQRVGGERWLAFDVRIIAATRRNLEQEVQAGRFRDDLFYRLSVARIELPPLRRREGDVGLLARHFWRTLGGTDSPAIDDFFQCLDRYDWPGNVRELYNVVLRRIALGDLAEAPNRATPVPGDASEDAIERILARELPFPRARDEIVSEFERRYVERVLGRYGGNVARAAAASGIARRYFDIIRRRQTKSETPPG